MAGRYYIVLDLNPEVDIVPLVEEAGGEVQPEERRKKVEEDQKHFRHVVEKKVKEMVVQEEEDFNIDDVEAGTRCQYQGPFRCLAPGCDETSKVVVVLYCVLY